MNTTSILESLTETFAAQGYEGTVVKDEAAAKHFAARYAEVATK